MSVEYAARGLIGVLTPQANTTVEPEYNILTPPGYAWINARMTSRFGTIEERLVDYFGNVHSFLPQFANAPIQSIAFACTGTSYLAGVKDEDRVLKEIEEKTGLPAMSAATSVCKALHVLGAKKIGLVSPYAGSLDKACPPYWEERGFKVAAKRNAEWSGENFHPIYSLNSDAAQACLDKMHDDDLDAIVMLGTGMPTLSPIARTPYVGRAPVFSCMLAIVWASVAAAGGYEPDRQNLLDWIEGKHWKDRMHAWERACGRRS